MISTEFIVASCFVVVAAILGYNTGCAVERMRVSTLLKGLTGIFEALNNSEKE